MPDDGKQLVICVNADGRPNEIPESKWIEADKVYTVKKIYNSQVNGPCIVLEEIDISDCWPYIGFGAHRFLMLT